MESLYDQIYNEDGSISFELRSKKWPDLFDDELDAAFARDAVSVRIHGEFAYLNFNKGAIS
jgi:hypothetical protein